MKVQDRPLTFSGAATPWSYIATWDNQLPVHAAIGSGLRVEAELEVVAGRVELGILAPDQSTFFDKAELHQGRHSVVLQAPDANAAAALVLRSGPSAIASTVAFRKLGGLPVARAAAKERGFLVKSAMQDLTGWLGGRDPCIVDVGANVGDTVDRFLKAFPEASIWAIEPHPETFELLRRRFGGTPRIHLRNIAMGERSSQATMFSYTNSAINALSPISTRAVPLLDGQVVPTASVSVSVRSMADFVIDENLDQIDILKLDTQGHELEILTGAADLLSSGKIRYVLTELTFAMLYERQSRSGEVIAALERCGFKLFDFYDFVYDPAQGLKWGDALFAFAGEDGRSAKS